MQATSENPDQPGPVEIALSVSSLGMVRMSLSNGVISIQPGLSSWDADLLAEGLVKAAAEARRIIASN